MNRQLWDMYKASPEGKACIEIFNPETDDQIRLLESIIEYSKECQPRMANLDEIKTDHLIEFISFLDENLSCQNLTLDNDCLRNSYEKLITDFFLAEIIEDEKGNISNSTNVKDLWLRANDFRRKSSYVHELSLYLYLIHPYFKPILFPYRYDLFLRNCDALGIELPPIPHTKDYKAFLMYYYDICTAMNKFQDEYEMTDEEFCACFYGFAKMLCDESKQAELPKPVNVWLTGASGGDFISLDEATSGKYEGDFNSIWACNERTKRGDIVVVYCLSPRSYIHSIWRANTAGIFNPFDYYKCRTTVCDGIRVPEISSKDLKADDYFSNVPIVRKNLQGINGVELSAHDYSELLRLIGQKGGDISALPKLYESENVDFGEIKLEKDVEENILIPMLRKLGYNEEDWTRQLSLKAGRGLKAIPDFVFFAKGDKHFETAPFVIEAKLDMSLIREQINAFSQGLSYAKMLRSSLMGICDKERLIIYRVDSTGSVDRNAPIFEEHWASIYKDPVVGAQLNQLIGKEVIKNL